MMVAPEILKSLQQVIQRFGFAGALRRVGLCDERALFLNERFCPRNRLCDGAGHEVCRVGLSLLVSLDILLTRLPLPADAKRVGKLDSDPHAPHWPQALCQPPTVLCKGYSRGHQGEIRAGEPPPSTDSARTFHSECLRLPYPGVRPRRRLRGDRDHRLLGRHASAVATSRGVSL